MTLKHALAGDEGAVMARLATAALVSALGLIGWLGSAAINDIKAGIDDLRVETASLRNLIAAQNATIQGLMARLDGIDRAQGAIDAEQNRRLDRLESAILTP